MPLKPRAFFFFTGEKRFYINVAAEEMERERLEWGKGMIRDVTGDEPEWKTLSRVEVRNLFTQKVLF